MAYLSQIDINGTTYDLKDTTARNTAGIYDSTLEKTQQQINTELTANKVNTSDYAPDSKTSEMTQSVGKDSNGKLWTTPVSSASIVSATETWLANNITQETGYVIDDSLSVAGAAADAATVGYYKNAIIEPTYNIWSGEPSYTFVRYKTIEGLNIPAGTYNISAVVTSTDTDKTVSRILFRNGTTQLTYIYFERDIRYNYELTLTNACDNVIIYAGEVSANSAGDTATWKDIQIVAGANNKPYLPHLLVSDFIARENVAQIGIEEIKFKSGRISNSYSSIYINNIQSASDWVYSVVPCKFRDKFIITGTGASTYRLYSFITDQASNNSLFNADANLSVTDYIAIAPYDAKYIVINARTTSAYSCTKYSYEYQKLKSDVAAHNELFEAEKLLLSNNFRYTTLGDIGSTVSLKPTASDTVDCGVYDCSKGDLFSFSGTGGDAGRLYAFIDSSNNLLMKSIPNLVADHLIVTAPENAVKIIICVLNTSEYEIYKGYPNPQKLKHEIENLKNTLIAPVLDNMTTNTALHTNDFRIVGDTLYRITTNIAANGTLVPGTNCIATTIGAEITALLNSK